MIYKLEDPHEDFFNGKRLNLRNYENLIVEHNDKINEIALQVNRQDEAIRWVAQWLGSQNGNACESEIIKRLEGKP